MLEFNPGHLCLYVGGGGGWGTMKQINPENPQFQLKFPHEQAFAAFLYKGMYEIVHPSLKFVSLASVY